MSEHILKDSFLDQHKLPGENELPYSDGIPMESQLHVMQMQLLAETLEEHFLDQDVYVGSNMFVYFSPDQVKTEDFRGQDVFVALNVSKRVRKSWVVWEEGKAPDVVIELISKSTSKTDKIKKKLIYQNQLRVAEYYWYDPYSYDWAGFRLESGIYSPIFVDKFDRLVSQKLDLALIRWQGNYRNVESTWLRWIDKHNNLLLTRGENGLRQAEQERVRTEQERVRAEQERVRAEKERVRAEQEKVRADKLAKKLRKLGVNPDDIS